MKLPALIWAGLAGHVPANRGHPVLMIELYHIFGPWIKEFSFIRKIVLYKNCDMLLFIVTFAANGELIEVAK